MSLIDILLHRANINAAIAKLDLWNDKKPNTDCQKMSQELTEALNGFDWLEKAYIKQKELTSTHKTLLELKVLELGKKIEELEKENRNLKNGL